jgi:iron complex outermembrane recepter protein
MAGAPMAFAQTPPVEAVDTDVIIVTSTRRDVSIQGAPLAVTALSGDSLTELGARGFDDYLRLIPGVTLNNGSANNTNIAIRGLSTETSNSNLQPTTALYINDLPVVDPALPIGYADLPSFDIDRVEALRGPQGTLFGSGSLGGAIRVITKNPRYGVTEGALELRLNDAEEAEGGGGASFMYNLPTGETSALRAVIDLNRQGGIIDNPTRNLKNVDRVETQNARVAWGWKPSDKLEVVGTLLYLNSQPEDNTLANDNGAQPFLTSTTVNLPYQTNSLSAEYIDYKTVIGSLDVNWDIGFAKLFSTTSYSTKDLLRSRDFGEIDSPLSSFYINTPLPSEEIANIDSKSFSQEVRLSSKGDSDFSWIGGVFYIKRETEVSSIEGDPGYLGSPAANPGTQNIVEYVVDPESTESAIFGEVAYRLTEKWKLALSGRFYQNEITQVDKVLWNFGSLGPAGTRTTKDDGFIPRLLVEYSYSPTIMSYATFSQGYRVGGLNIPQPGLPSDFGPDTVDAYELGIKSRLFNKRLTLNTAIFRNNWKDIQVNEIIGNTAALTNGPQAYSQGLEVEARYKIQDGLTLGWSGAFTDAQADEDAPGVNANRGGIRKGDKLPGVADFTSNLQLRYSKTVSDAMSWYALADHTYFSGAYNGFNITDPFVKEIPDWDKLNLRVGVNYNNLELIVYIENLTNNDNVISVAYNGGFQRDSLARIRPRTMGLTLRSEF